MITEAVAKCYHPPGMDRALGAILSTEGRGSLLCTHEGTISPRRECIHEKQVKVFVC